MGIVNTIFGVPLGFVMNLCYRLSGNYALAIILFTLVTKVLLLPVAVWVHKNGIKIVRMQPAINQIKARFFGDPDAIAEEQSKLYKREKYNPLASLLPLAIQIVLLIGLIHVIYHPLTYVLRIPQEGIDMLSALGASLTGVDPATASIELSVLEAARMPSFSAQFLSLSGALSVAEREGILSAVNGFHTALWGLDVGWVPSARRGLLIAVPLLAGLSAWLLGLVQGRLNPLQAEQGKVGRYATTALSVGLSLYLGWFVPVGVALYWIVSNLYAIAQQFALNRWMDPRAHVDYAALAESKRALAALENIQGKRRPLRKDAHATREKTDYKRFFSIANKHLVFYSEKSGFYKYFQGMITYLLAHSNLTIHYVTSDPEDQIFALSKEHPQIKPYYIGEKKLITLMMKMDADLVVMTMPDLDSFHIKRSYVRKDIEYIFVAHYMITSIRVLRKGALDHFDTVFCTGPKAVEEIRQVERETGAPPKRLVECGYGLLDLLIAQYQRMPPRASAQKRILIAPSWQEGNIMESCLYEIASQLLDAGYEVAVRPHPQYGKRFPAQYQAIEERLKAFEGRTFFEERDFSSNESVYAADLLITDWSSISFEYAFATCKPVLFIDTPMKVINEDMQVAHDQEPPLDIRLRNVVGVSISVDFAKENAASTAFSLFDRQAEYAAVIERVRGEEIFHVGESAKYEAGYILSRFQKEK